MNHYRAAVQREFEETGVRPELDPLVQAILDGKARPVSKGEAPEPSPPATEAQPKGNRFVRIATWPFRETARLFKWLASGFWEDVKHVADAIKQRLPWKTTPES